jgi:hypothetical protein
MLPGRCGILNLPLDLSSFSKFRVRFLASSNVDGNFPGIVFQPIRTFGGGQDRFTCLGYWDGGAGIRLYVCSSVGWQAPGSCCVHNEYALKQNVVQRMGFYPTINNNVLAHLSQTPVQSVAEMHLMSIQETASRHSQTLCAASEIVEQGFLPPHLFAFAATSREGCSEEMKSRYCLIRLQPTS